MKKSKPTTDTAQPAEATPGADFARISIDRIQASPTNPRKTFPQESLESLADNIKRIDVLQPILVRPWPDSYPHPEPRPDYELVAGERRWRAAKMAGKSDIPATIRQLTDAETLEIQVVENLQRENPHELEEAEGYDLLMCRHGYTVDMLAEKVNRSRAYIYARLKLTALVQEAREAFYAGKLTASTALLVARIPTPDMQRQAMEKIINPNPWGGSDEPMSARAAAQHVRQNYMLKLSRAPFPPETRDPVAHAPHCDECGKRTGNQPEIYPDCDADVCTDPVCYGHKKEAHQALLVERAKNNGQQIFFGDAARKIAPYGIHDIKGGFVALDTKCYQAPERDGGAPTYRELLGENYQAPALLENRDGTMAEIAQIDDIAELLRGNGIDVKIGKSASDKQKSQERQAKIENAYRARLFDAIGKIPYADARLTIPVEHDDLVAIALAFFNVIWHENQKRLARWWLQDSKNTAHALVAEFAGHIEHQMTDPALCLLLRLLSVIGEINVQPYTTNHTPKKMLAAAARYGIDAAAIRRQVMSEWKAKEKTKKPPKEAAAPTLPDDKTADIFQGAAAQ